MKEVLIITLFCLSLFVLSCSKIKINTDRIQGTWSVTKVEVYHYDLGDLVRTESYSNLKSKIVFTGNIANNEIGKYSTYDGDYFSNNDTLIFWMNDSVNYNSTFTWQASKSNEITIMFPNGHGRLFDVIENKKDNFVLEKPHNVSRKYKYFYTGSYKRIHLTK